MHIWAIENTGSQLESTEMMKPELDDSDSTVWGTAHTFNIQINTSDFVKIWSFYYFSKAVAIDYKTIKLRNRWNKLHLFLNP